MEWFFLQETNNITKKGLEFPWKIDLTSFVRNIDFL